VWRVSGRPLSEWQRARAANAANAANAADAADAAPAAGAAAQARARWPLVSLEPASRAWLHERLAQRFAQMLERGFVDEVRALRARGDLHPGLPSMRCVGYRQAWAALERGRLDVLAATGVAATRQLAKRQLTWLRSLPERLVVACDEPGSPAGGPAAIDDVHGADALARGMQALRLALQRAGWRWPAPCAPCPPRPS
jgi:tRNA dimethylallyltransferase